MDWNGSKELSYDYHNEINGLGYDMKCKMLINASS